MIALLSFIGILAHVVAASKCSKGARISTKSRGGTLITVAGASDRLSCEILTADSRADRDVVLLKGIGDPREV
jgi:hypothetical protein